MNSATSFRQVALSPEDMVRVLLDANVHPEQRVGAAVALQKADPQGTRERLRAVADGVVDHRLRASLEYLGGEDVEPAGIEEALERVGSDPAVTS